MIVSNIGSQDFHCDNLKGIFECLSEGLKTTKVICTYKHYIGNCLCDCKDIKPECREKIKKGLDTYCKKY